MAVPDASGALMDRYHPSHSVLRNSKHSNHRHRSRKHFPLSIMPHSHRGKRKLQLDLDSEWDYDGTTPCIEGGSDDYSSLESNCNLPDHNPGTLPNLRKLCEDFPFSLDSLNDNLHTRPASPPLTNVTALHCPFASTVKENLPTISIQARALSDKATRVNLSDYESDIEDEDNRDYEDEIPLIIDSDCTGDEDSLHEFVTCSKYSSAGFGYHSAASPSAIPFKQVTSVSTISASNSFDSIPTTSSNESLRTISSFSTSSGSSEYFPCPENYDMLYRNFEIAAKMEECKTSDNNEQTDQTSSMTSTFSSNVSFDSSTFKRNGETLVDNTQKGDSNKVTTFAKLADSRCRSPDSTTRELTSFSLHSSSTITHWTEVLSKQCHSTKSSPESGINSPVDECPDSPKVKRPHFLPLQLRHIQRPSAKPNTNGGEPGLGLLRTLSAPGGFDNTSKQVLSHNVLEQLTKPSQSQSVPSIYHDTRPQTVVVSTKSTLDHPVVSSKVKEDGGSAIWQEDILDALPPQEMTVSPKSSERQQDLDLINRKRDLVLAIKSAIQQVQELFDDRTHNTLNQVTMETTSFNNNLCQLVVKCLCPAVEDLVKDGMKPYSSSWLMGRIKNTPWIVIQATTELGPGTRSLNGLFNTIAGAGIHHQSSLRFNAFVMGLLNEDLLSDWLEHCRDHPNIMRKYYEPDAFFNLCNSEPYSDLLTELLTALRRLSRLHFQLNYLHESQLLNKGETKTGHLVKMAQTADSREGIVTSPNSRESRGSYIDSKKLASSVWNFYSKVKSYASQNTSDVKSAEAQESDNDLGLDRRGECDGEPSESLKGCELDQTIVSDGSSETRWSKSWIQGFANTVPSPPPQELTNSDDSQKTPTKTWGEVLKSSKWGSGFSQMMPKISWKTNQSALDSPFLNTKRTSPAPPPLYERHVSGCGTPITGGEEMVECQSHERGFYSSIRTRVKTRCHYVSLNPGELSFMKGDILTVRGQTSNEWLLCSIGPDSGLVHVDYIQEVK